MKKFLFIFLFFFIADVIFFWSLWSTYFQQDEWYGFSNIIIASSRNIYSPLFSPDLHYVPLVYILRFITYRIFGLHADYYAWASLILHSMVATAAYFFFKNLIKKNVPAFMMAFIFLISFPARQAVVWQGESIISLLPSSLLILLFFIFLEKFRKQIDHKRIVLLGLIFFGGIFLKEDTIILIPLVPLYIFLFWTRDSINKVKKPLFYLAFFVLAVGLIDVWVHLLSITHNTQTLRIDKAGDLKSMAIYNMSTVPFKMIVQNFIEYGQLINFSFSYALVGFPKLAPNGLAVLTAVYQNVIFYISIFISALVSFSFAKSNNKNKKLILFALAWIVIYSIPVSLQTRILAEMESRYLFLANIGVLLLSYGVFNSFYSSREIVKNTATTLGILLFIIITWYFYWGDRYVMNLYNITSTQRKSIINQLTTHYPTIPKDATIYIGCKDPKDCYPLTLPFQSSVGEILLVIYSPGREKGYAPLLEDPYLFDWMTQGYKKVGNYGFGYFTDMDKLKEAVKKDKIPVNSIISFSYDKYSNKLVDISSKVKKDLKLINKQ